MDMYWFGVLRALIFFGLGSYAVWSLVKEYKVTERFPKKKIPWLVIGLLVVSLLFVPFQVRNDDHKVIETYQTVTPQVIPEIKIRSRQDYSASDNAQEIEIITGE